jgi:hypothetical protein
MKGVNEMALETNAREKLDALYDRGRDFVERPLAHGSAVEYEFNVCSFDTWRKKVNDLLFSLGGCEDVHYQRFSKGVAKPNVRDLREGLRILADVRDRLH